MEDHRRSEHDWAEYFGRRVYGSGSGSDKNDLQGLGPYDGLMGENKHTIKKSFAVAIDTWVKARREAKLSGARPILRIDYNSKLKLIVMDEEYFRQLHET